MLTIPNLLTMSRIVAVPILVALLWAPGEFEFALAFGLYVLVGVTDFFDGYLARRMGLVSRLGAFLDPIADKIMVVAVLLMLVSTRQTGVEPVIGGPHIVAAMAILLREIFVSGLREYLGGLQVSVPVSKLAKWKTTFQMIALGALILAGAITGDVWVMRAGLACLWLSAVLTVVTGWDYLRIGLRHMS